MWLTIYAICLVVLSALPVAVFLANLPLFRCATREPSILEQAGREQVSVLIPARNEEKGIEAALDRFSPIAVSNWKSSSRTINRRTLRPRSFDGRCESIPV